MPLATWEQYWSDEANHEWWERPAPEVMQFLRTQSADQRPQLLDLGCGLGRHAITCALAGFQVTAIDFSSTAIDHLNGWAAKLGLSINTKIGDVLEEGLAHATYDIVLSYNVIYHGYREDFAGAISRVHALLKRGGLFFFTCPTRQDGKYGYGEQVAPHTFLCTKSMTPGDMHYFANERDLDLLLEKYRQVSRDKDEGFWMNDGVRQRYSNWVVLAEKI